MKLVTRNSIYEVKTDKGEFVLTKVFAFNPQSTFNAMGQSRRAAFLTLRLGEPVLCGDWHTSELRRIE